MISCLKKYITRSCSKPNHQKSFFQYLGQYTYLKIYLFSLLPDTMEQGQKKSLPQKKKKKKKKKYKPKLEEIQPIHQPKPEAQLTKNQAPIRNPNQKPRPLPKFQVVQEEGQVEKKEIQNQEAAYNLGANDSDEDEEDLPQQQEPFSKIIHIKKDKEEIYQEIKEEIKGYQSEIYKLKKRFYCPESETQGSTIRLQKGRTLQDLAKKKLYKLRTKLNDYLAEDSRNPVLIKCRSDLQSHLDITLHMVYDYRLVRFQRQLDEQAQQGHPVIKIIFELHMHNQGDKIVEEIRRVLKDALQRINGAEQNYGCKQKPSLRLTFSTGIGSYYDSMIEKETQKHQKPSQGLVLYTTLITLDYLKLKYDPQNKTNYGGPTTLLTPNQFQRLWDKVCYMDQQKIQKNLYKIKANQLKYEYLGRKPDPNSIDSDDEQNLIAPKPKATEIWVRSSAKAKPTQSCFDSVPVQENGDNSSTLQSQRRENYSQPLVRLYIYPSFISCELKSQML